jgi:uncharacterized protein (TIGR02147 family)
MTSVYEASDYRSYLLGYLRAQPKKGRGLRGQWAEAAGCQVAYVSHVLGGTNDFSLEQAEAISRQIGHSKEEQEYFVLLVQKARSGTNQLRQFFQNMLNEKLAHHHNIRHRMKIKETLKIADQAIYYSKWYYAAIHILLTIPEYRTATAISQYFAIPLAETKEYLEFLETRQLIELKSGHYSVRGAFLHISKDSPLFFHQQISWRQRAIDSVYKNRPDEVHFASCFSLSAKDVDRIKALLSQTIETSTEIIKPSKEERLYSICLDFFEVRA